MKKTITMLMSILAIPFVWAASLTDGYVNSPTVTLGQWNWNFSAVKSYADKNHVPLLMFYGSTSCGYCDSMINNGLNSSAFRNWVKTHPICMVFQDKSQLTADAAKKFVKEGSTSRNLPYMKIYWPKADGSKVNVAFTGRLGQMPSKKGADRGEQLVNSLNSLIGEYFDRKEPSVAFAVGKTACDRLECEEATKTVLAPIVRTGEVGGVSTNTVWIDQVLFTNVIWASGQTKADVEVPVMGKTVRLELKNADGKVLDETSITFVVRPISTKNPLWLGERDAATLRPGEWTMDVDLARACAKANGTFTLNLVGGSLWCPDCVKTDRYLVETPTFEEWLATNGVYCSMIDIPRLASNGKTCLLTYEAATASDGYVSALTNGTDIAAEDVRVQSGAGYLSRKGADPDMAAQVFARNVGLATNLVADGGLCVPGKARLGVPTFVVQNAEGRVIGRFDKFATVSPTDSKAAAAYVRRLDEILQLKDDPTEELNRDWSTATTDDCALSVRNGERTSTISAIDLSDYWRLTAIDRWTRTTFTVKGRTGETAEENVRLNFWQVTDGKATKVATVAGNLAMGVTLPQQVIAPASATGYFIQIEAIDKTNTVFALDRDADSVVTYTLSAESTDDAGTVSFEKTSGTVSEADAKTAGGTLRVFVPVVRTGGASGATNVSVTVDADSTAFADRYRLVTDTVSWADGETGTKNVEIEVFDDDNADGAQTLRLLLGTESYELTIVDNDKATVGKVALVAVEPALAKKGVSIAPEGSRVRLGVVRLGGASGDVSCSLKATAGSFPVSPTFVWSSRESGMKEAELDLPTLTNCPSGKVTVSFDSLTGVKADASARTLTIQLVGADAPRFAVDSLSLNLTRYCAVSQEVAVLNLANGAKPRVAKLSGSVPAGISVKLAGDRFVFSGTPTARGGDYEAVYQVSQTVGRKKDSGLTIRLAFAVTDVAVLDPSAPGANPSVRTRRTIPDMMVIDEAGGRLVGILSNLTIQPTGRCTAKYKCAEGTIALMSKSWSVYDDATGALTAELTASSVCIPYSLSVTARADGLTESTFTDPFVGRLAVVAPAMAWSRENPATAWVGRCAVAFGDVEGEVLAEGAPVVTLQMAASAARTGTMRYAGFLPNGQAFSGSAVLVADDVDTALLPICYRTAKDFFTAVLRIKANGAVQAVECDEGILPCWIHTEALPEAGSYVRYGSVFGSWIDAKQNLLETVNPQSDGHDLVAVNGDDKLEIPVVISEKTAKLDSAVARKFGATLSLNRTTGLVSGRFKTLDAAGRTVTANYRGVLLPDWGDGCSTCSDGDGAPWALGAFWFSEKLTGEVNGRPRTVTVKVGNLLYIESN